MTVLLLVLVAALLLLGAPLFIAVGALTLGLLAQLDQDPQAIIIELYRTTSSPNLVVIPLFALTGVIMARSGMPRRLLALAQALLGWIPGASALITLVMFEFFTAFTGASGLSILATGTTLYAILRGGGFSDRFSLGLISSAGSLGVLLPPSIVVIFYGTLTQTSIHELFKAGLLPSLVMLVILGAYCLWRGRLELTRTPFSLAALRPALWAARYELPLPVLVLGGIYSGILTVNEAATLCVVYVAIVEGPVYREVSWRRDLVPIVEEAMILVGAILVLLGVALGLTSYFIDQAWPERLLEALSGVLTSRVQFLVGLNLVLLAAGCVLDVFSALVLLIPLLTPLAMQFGIHPLHLGILFLANLEIGYSTPPVGLNLFVSALTFKRPLREVVVAVVPFVLLLLLSVLIITFVPELSTWPAADAPGGMP